MPFLNSKNISNLLSPLQSKAKYIWIYCNLASTFKSDDSFSSTDDLEQKQTKRKLSQKVKVRRPLIVAFIWLLIAGQQPGVFASLDKTSPKPLAPVVWNQNLIRVDPGLATLLQRPWAPPCWNLLLRSTHPKAGSLSCPLTSSTGRSGATRLSHNPHGAGLRSRDTSILLQRRKTCSKHCCWCWWNVSKRSWVVVVIKGVDRSYWPDQKKIKNVGSDLPRDLQVPGVTCRALSRSVTTPPPVLGPLHPQATHLVSPVHQGRTTEVGDLYSLHQLPVQGLAVAPSHPHCVHDILPCLVVCKTNMCYIYFLNAGGSFLCIFYISIHFHTFLYISLHLWRRIGSF